MLMLNKGLWSTLESTSPPVTTDSKGPEANMKKECENHCTKYHLEQ